MLPVLLAIFLLGIVAGLRTFTAPAAVWIARHYGVWAIVLAVCALAEYAADLYPRAPARTSAGALLARIASGAFVGWALAAPAGISVVVGAILGIAGAIAGAYGGLALRMKAADAVGPIPAALIEDGVAIGLAFVVLARS